MIDESCEVDPCTGYVQGTTGVPSITCPSGCTLTGDGVTETCTATVSDCVTNYVAGDASTPSITCPSGCIQTDATFVYSAEICEVDPCDGYIQVRSQRIPHP